MVEYVLADISVRLDLKFPYAIEKRIKAAKKIVDRSEYAAYRNDFHRVCDEFPRYEELRHFPVMVVDAMAVTASRAW